MIDGLKNNAAPKEKKNRPKESILAKLNEKKEEVARRSGQKAMQQVMGQDMERTKNKNEKLVTLLWLASFFTYKKTGQ